MKLRCMHHHFLLISMGNMNLYNQSVHLACWPVCIAKTLKLDTTFKNVKLFVFHGMLIGIIDFYCFMPVSMTLTLAEVHKVSAKQEPVGFIFMNIFQLISIMLKQFSLNSLVLLLE